VTTAAPSGQVLADSRELTRRIAAEIDAAGGWIGFDRYMQRALYEPGIGYYSGPNRVFGAEGDFVTAPEMSSLFGGCVAAQCAQWLDADAGIVEFGAGSGALAAQVLSALRETRDEFAKLALSSDYDEAKVKTLADRNAQAISEMAQLRARNMNEIYKVLTPEQQAKVQERMSRRATRG
jgi:SAM-dependent MidA family methyltransferase